MNTRPCLFAATLWLSLSAALAAQQPAPAPVNATLVSVKKIWDRGGHNAFTDLIRFQNLFYCCFRESQAHVGGEGVVRILSSYDALTWAPVAEIKVPGVDLRDPKLGITKDERMICFMGGSIYKGTTLVGRQPLVATSTDGKDWSPTVKALGEGDWLWQSTWNDQEKKFYGTVYNTHPNSAGPKDEAEWSLKLYTSLDGKVWQLNAPWDIKGRPSEATTRVLPDGTMLALVRRDMPGSNTGMIGSASAPYREWKWTALKVPLGVPNFIVLPDGKVIAGSRGFGKTPGPHMVLFSMDATSLTPILELPSSGDCSYPGMVFNDGTLYVSYYSSHEGNKASIYLAQVKIQ